MAVPSATEAYIQALLYDPIQALLYDPYDDAPVVDGSLDPVIPTTVIYPHTMGSLPEHKYITETLDLSVLQDTVLHTEFLHKLVQGVIVSQEAAVKQEHPRCVGLSIIFPASLLYIRDEAFKAFSVEDSVGNYWTFYAAGVDFTHCLSLKYIGIDAFSSNTIKTLVLPKTGSTIALDELCFGYSHCLTDITWGSVAHTNKHAFMGSNQLRYLNFEDSLLNTDDSFGKGVFDQCTQLQYVKCRTAVPSGVLENWGRIHDRDGGEIRRVVVVPDEDTRIKAMHQLLPFANIQQADFTIVTADDASAYFRETWVKKRVGHNVPWIAPGTARELDSCVRSCDDLFEKYEFQPLRANLRTLVTSANRAEETVKLPHLPRELFFGEIAKYYCDMTLQAQ